MIYELKFLIRFFPDIESGFALANYKFKAFFKFFVNFRDIFFDIFKNSCIHKKKLKNSYIFILCIFFL